MSETTELLEFLCGLYGELLEDNETHTLETPDHKALREHTRNAILRILGGLTS